MSLALLLSSAPSRPLGLIPDKLLLWGNYPPAKKKCRKEKPGCKLCMDVAMLLWRFGEKKRLLRARFWAVSPAGCPFASHPDAGLQNWFLTQLASATSHHLPVGDQLRDI